MKHTTKTICAGLIKAGMPTPSLMRTILEKSGNVRWLAKGTFGHLDDGGVGNDAAIHENLARDILTMHAYRFAVGRCWRLESYGYQTMDNKRAIDYAADDENGTPLFETPDECDRALAAIDAEIGGSSE